MHYCEKKQKKTRKKTKETLIVSDVLCIKTYQCYSKPKLHINMFVFEIEKILDFH